MNDKATPTLKEPTADLIEVVQRLADQEDFFDVAIAEEVSQELVLIKKLAREAGYSLEGLA